MSSIGNYLTRLVYRRPFFLLGLTGIAQRLKPLFKLGKTTVVLGAIDVRDVFERADIFELGPVGERKMLCGKFLLGMDQWPIYLHDKKILQDVIDSCAYTRLDEIVIKHCKAGMQTLEQTIQARRDQNGNKAVNIDLVREFAEPVITRIAAEFFLGIEELEGLESDVVGVESNHGFMTKDEQIFARWLLYVGSVIATTEPAPFGLQKIARASADELRIWLTRLCKTVLSDIETNEEQGGDVSVAHDFWDGQGNAGHFSTCRNVIYGVVQNFRDDPYPDNDPPHEFGRHSERAGENTDVVSRSQRNIAGLMLAGSTPLIHSLSVAVDQLLEHSEVLTGEIPSMDPMSIFSNSDVSFHAESDTDDDMPAIEFHAEGLMKPNSAKGVAFRYDFAAKRVEKIAGRRDEIRDGILSLSPEADFRSNPRFMKAQNELFSAVAWRAQIEDEMTHLVYEAMRFNPTFPFLARHCPRHDVAGTNAADQIEVRAGSTIIASQLAAMHDAALFPIADTFAYRPIESYMHFGYGDHQCIGMGIATKIITQMALHLMHLENVETIAPGIFSFDGPTVSSYVLTVPPLEADSS